MESSQNLRVFLCHASGDKPFVRKLYVALELAGISPWLDEKNLIAGEEWASVIPKMIRESHAVIVCLSEASISKTGYVQKEIRYALDIADEQPEGAIFIIPVRLEECVVPERLRKWHWIDLYKRDGFENLLRALIARAESLGIILEQSALSEDLHIRFLNHEDSVELDDQTKLASEVIGLSASGDLEKAFEKLNAYLAIYPNDCELLYHFASDLLEMHRKYKEVIDLLTNLERFENCTPAVRGRLLKLLGMARLRLWYRSKRTTVELEKSRIELLRSVENNPRIAESYLHLAIIYALKGDLNETDSYLRKSIETSGDSEMSLRIESLRESLRVDSIKFLYKIRHLYDPK